MQTDHTHNPVRLKSRRGAAMVEMAMVLSVLMLLVFGMIDMGLILRSSLALSHLAKNAARSYALGTDQGTVTDRVEKGAKSLGLDENQLDVSFAQHEDTFVDSQSQSTDTQTLYNMEVTLTYKHNTVAGKLVGLGDEVTLTGVGVHIKE